MEERRKLKRRHLLYYSRVFDRVTGKQLGHIMDITAEGIMLISDEPIPVDETFHLRMDLPEDILSRPHLQFDAHSVWCQPDINPDFYNTGFRVNLASHDIALIERMIVEYGFRD